MVNTVTESSTQVRKTRKELLSEWRRQEVVEAARRIFARVGYAEANVEEIAKEAGMAKGTVYLYFKSKEEIFAAVLSRDVESLTDRTIDGMSKMKTFEDRLSVFLNLRLAFIQQNQDYLSTFLATGGSGSRSTLISEAIDKPFRRGFEFMRQCLEQAIAEGELRAVPVEQAAFAIFDLSRGFAERHIRGLAKRTLEEDLTFAHSLIMSGLRNK